MLRAVKVSFHGWGSVMDAWFPVDSGMVAKPGTHLPLVCFFFFGVLLLGGVGGVFDRRCIVHYV